MTNSLPNDDSPDDEFKISEDKLREFLESSQKDFDYTNPRNNKAFGADVKDQEIIDFIERVNRIRSSMEAENPANTQDFDKLVDKIDNLNVVSKTEVAELVDVFKMATEEMRLRAVDPASIEQIVEIVSYQQERILLIMKQLSTLRMIVFALIATVFSLIGFIVCIIIAVTK